MSRARRAGFLAWPPTPYPPREPNPNGDDLLEPVDWMTFSHRDLYLMATTRLHPETARELSGEWLRVGRKLDEIADKLVRLNRLTGGAWEGAAAEVARDTGRQLSAWADESGNGARGVADYLDRHAGNAEWASREMPEPDGDRGPDRLPNWRRDDPDDDGPTSSRPAADGGGTTPSSAAGRIDFDAARFLVEDEGEARERRQRKHQRAAAIMARMQANAVEILGTIPRFTTPVVTRKESVGDVGGRTDCDPPSGATTAAGYSGPSGGSVGAAPETQPLGARPTGNGQVSGLPSGGMTSGNAGNGGLVRGPVTAGVAPLGGPATAAAGRGVGMLGGADRRGGPAGLISPGAGRRADDDAKRRSRALVSGDAAIFEPDEDPAPRLEATEDHDETPQPPGYAPPPISLDRLPGNWVRQGA